MPVALFVLMVFCEYQASVHDSGKHKYIHKIRKGVIVQSPLCCSQIEHQDHNRCTEHTARTDPAMSVLPRSCLPVCQRSTHRTRIPFWTLACSGWMDLPQALARYLQSARTRTCNQTQNLDIPGRRRKLWQNSILARVCAANFLRPARPGINDREAQALFP